MKPHYVIQNALLVQEKTTFIKTYHPGYVWKFEHISRLYIVGILPVFPKASKRLLYQIKEQFCFSVTDKMNV